LKDKVKGGQHLVGVRKVGKNSVLLHGPPGNGKSSLVQAAANEAKATLLLIRPSDVLSKYHGESESILKNLFESAENSNKPTIIFFDEFDSLASTRGPAFDDAAASSRRSLVSELLLALNNSKCTVVAATNRIEDIDEAAIRRFALKVHVGVPESRSTRIKLVNHFLSVSEVPHKLTEAEVGVVAGWTAGWSGSDIEDICREAAMGIIRRISCISSASSSSEDLEPYDYEMALAALEESLANQSDVREPEGFVILEDFERAYSSFSVGFEAEAEETKEDQQVH
jgi:SpoVK/Ycf46/Vps4 family AAA+-type ATPase